AAQRAAAGDHDRRAAVRLAAVGRDHHREGVRPPGARHDAAERDLRAQLPGGPGHRAGDRRHLRGRQHARRSGVRAGRPEDPARMKLSPSAWIGLVMLGVFVVLGLLGPYLAPYDVGPHALDLAHRYEGSSADHWLGTDATGRDTLSQLLWGARSALQLSAIVVAISATVGLTAGTVAGWFRGAVD